MASKNMEKWKQTHAALDLFFDRGYSRREAAEKFGLSDYYINTELYDHRVCYHPQCKKHACRAAKRGSNKIMFCSALTDTNFGYRDCPFYKTEDDFNFEYRLTNKMTEAEAKALGY